MDRRRFLKAVGIVSAAAAAFPGCSSSGNALWYWRDKRQRDAHEREIAAAAARGETVTVDTPAPLGR